MRWRVAPVLVCMALSGPAAAHHSLSAYDRTRPITLPVTVVRFQLINPHAILIARSDADGRVWQMEMDNRHELVDIGIDADTFKPGQRVIVIGDPARGEGPSLYLRRLDRPSDGLRYEQVGFTPSISKAPPRRGAD